jgi:transcriptional regulator with XRE-family HTH domain
MTGEERMFLLGMAARCAQDGSGRRIRAKANVPMSEMAQLVGVKIPTMSRWENGQRRPRGDAAVRWAALLVSLEGTAARSVA